MYFHIMIGAGSYTTSTTTIPSKRVRDGLVFRYSGTGDIVDDGTGNVHLNHIKKIIALEHTRPLVFQHHQHQKIQRQAFASLQHSK